MNERDLTQLPRSTGVAVSIEELDPCDLSIVVAAAAVVAFTVAAMPAAASQVAPAGASQIRNPPRFLRRQAQEARPRPASLWQRPQQIACTYLGCNPIPRGCRIEPGRIPFTWDPSGFDEVQCPYYR